MLEYVERLSVNDFEEAMDFLDLVYSKEYKPHDFEEMLPKLYYPTEESMQNHLAIRKNGRIRAIMGMYPTVFHIGSTTLRAIGIGAVATHHKDRKSGFMRRLMETGIEEMYAKGIHLSYLGGLRHRYRYYGYEKTGTVLDYHMTKNNIRNELPDVLERGIHFEPIRENDHILLSRAKELYDSQPLRCERPSKLFYFYLKSWYMCPWAAFDKNGKMVGYLVANNDGTQIKEIIADNTELFSYMIYQWILEHDKDGISLTLPPWAVDYIRKAGSISESVSVREACNWRIFDWEKVVGALFEVKSGFSRLADGEVNFGIKNYGVISIRVNNGLISCKKTSGKPDINCDESTAMRLMFGPLSPYNVMEFSDCLAPLFSSWFPLPLCCLYPDKV